MMSDKIMLEGGCLCSAIRYSVSDSPFAADYCHCRMCQRSTGAIVGTWMDFLKTQVTWYSAHELTEYASSEKIRRGFCGKCGSTLSYRDVSYPDYLSLAIASLDNPDLVKPTYHIYTDSQVKWLKIDDDCTRYPQGQEK